MSTQWSDLEPFVGNGTKVKISFEIKPPLKISILIRNILPSQNVHARVKPSTKQKKGGGGCYSRKYIKLYLHFIGSCSIFLPLFWFQISLLCQHFWGPNSGTKWVICNYLKSIYEYFSLQVILFEIDWAIFYTNLHGIVLSVHQLNKLGKFW